MGEDLLDPQLLQRDPSVVPVGFWQRDGDRLACTLCPRACKLADGQRGLCWVRGRIGTTMVLTTWGRSSGFCVDPIEKKPLNHFLPGSPVLSFGTAGCNLSCRFCQNWSISKSRADDTLAERGDPEAIAATALRLGCPSVALTYNDPVIYLEYAVAVAQACRARGLKTVAVTAGYLSPEAGRQLWPHIDAANIDLKAFSDDFYIHQCGGHLQPVLDTLRDLVHHTAVWLELTTLLIPGLNDSDDELGALSSWVAKELSPDVPLHFTAFHPSFKLLDRPATPPATLSRARAIAQKAGLRYVYTGNVHDPSGASTWCAGCGALLVERDWYTLGRYRLADGHCPDCGQRCAGHWTPQAGQWGRQRMPVQLH